MNWRLHPHYAPEDGGAGGGGDAPASAAPGRSGDTGANAGAAPGSAAPPAWAPPDFLPEGLRDVDVNKTFDKVAGDWKRLRDTVAALPQPPKSIDEYKFEPSDKVKPYVGDLAADPAFALMRDAALKAGVPAAQFSGVVGAFYEGLVEKGMAPAPYDAVKEQTSLLGPQAAAMTAQERGEAMKPIVMPLVEQIEGLERTSAFSSDPKVNKAAAAALAPLLDTADGVRALKALFALAPKQPGLNPGGAPATNLSPAQIKARMSDPRYDPSSHAYDANFRNETMDLYRKTFA